MSVVLSRFYRPVTAMILGMALLAAPSLWGQDKGKGGKKGGTPPARTKPIANTRNLDLKAESLTNSFVRDAESLADEYLEAGHPDKARAVLQSVLTLNPNQASAAQKLEQIGNQAMSSNRVTFELNASHGWESAGVMVADGRPVRFGVDGTYKLDISGTVNGGGLVENDPTKDLLTGIPCGALVGIVMGKDNKPGKPFLIGAGGDITPRESGKLLLKINAPQGHKSTGKLKITMSGNLAAG